MTFSYLLRIYSMQLCTQKVILDNSPLTLVILEARERSMNVLPLYIWSPPWIVGSTFRIYNSLYFSYLEFKGEVNSSMGFLQGILNSTFISFSEFFSGDNCDVFFSVEDSVVFNIFVTNSGKQIHSLIFDEGVYMITTNF